MLINIIMKILGFKCMISQELLLAVEVKRF